MPESRLAGYAGMIRWVSVAVIVASLLTLGVILPLQELGLAVQRGVGALGMWGPVALALLYVVATVAMVPGWMLTLVAGALFGLVVGTITVSIGSTTGAACAFLIGRYAARDAVARYVRERPRLRAVDQAIGEGGWKIVVMLRLSPAVPFNLQNYLYGVTRIRFWPCVLASWAAMLPGTFLYVYLGHIAGAAVAAAGEHERTLGEWLVLAVGLIATVVVTVYITKLARQKLREQTPLENEELETPEDAAAAGEHTAEPEQAEQAAARQLAGVPIKTLLLAAVALLIAIGTGIGFARQEALEQAISRLAGPAAVVMEEAYEPRPDGPTFDHSTFDEILQQHVIEGGWVDYAALAEDPQPLDEYIEAIAAAPFDAMGRDEKLALLINAYNAFTLRLMLDHPTVESIRDIPANERWDGRTWQIGEHRWTLNEIEHEQIRPRFIEPRIHWALVCAAVGCPPLRREAYVGDRIEQQLAEQERIVHEDERWLRFDADRNRLYLTRLYDWYAGDYEQVAGSVLDYVAEHAPEVREAMEAGRSPSIRWLEYDWTLNSVEHMP